MTDDSRHARGLLLGAAGGLALTFDIPALRLADGDMWSTLAVRSFAMFAAAFVLWGAIGLLTGRTPVFVPGRTGWIVAGLYGAIGLLFIVAIFNTSTANVVFILAFNSVFAAFLGWLAGGERPPWQTMYAMAAMIFGVWIIVSGSLVTGNWIGDLAALGAALTIATAITITRRSRLDMGLAPLAGAILPGIVALFFVAEGGFRLASPAWAIFDGAVIMAVSMFCLAIAPRYISGPEVAMFYLLETVLTPVWVWILFGEETSTRAMVGGGIILAALVTHTVWQYRRSRRSTLRRAPPPLAPAMAE